MVLKWAPISTLSKVTRPWEVNFCRQMAIKTPLESSALPLLESGRKRTVKRVQNRSSGPSFMYYRQDKVFFGILAESWTSLAARTIRIANTHEDKRLQDSTRVKILSVYETRDWITLEQNEKSRGINGLRFLIRTYSANHTYVERKYF